MNACTTVYDVGPAGAGVLPPPVPGTVMRLSETLLSAILLSAISKLQYQMLRMLKEMN